MKEPIIKAFFIDDSATETYLVQLIIEEYEIPIEATFTDSAEEALVILKGMEVADRPQVIFIDLNMPRMNGFEFVEEYEKYFGANKKDLPLFYILTSSIRTNDRDKAKDYAKLSGFFEKPFSEDIFKAVALDLKGG